MRIYGQPTLQNFHNLVPLAHVALVLDLYVTNLESQIPSNLARHDAVDELLPVEVNHAAFAHSIRLPRVLTELPIEEHVHTLEHKLLSHPLHSKDAFVSEEVIRLSPEKVANPFLRFVQVITFILYFVKLLYLFKFIPT